MRSVAVGLLVAAIIGASYPYVVLKFGFGPNISVVSAFFGFLAVGLFSKSYNRWENNIVQTAGTAAGQIAFLCWLLAAFDMLAAEPGSGFDVHLTRMQTFLWLTASGLLVPLRKHFIEDEKLPFPDGIAAGETLIMLDSRGPQARQSAFVMIGSLLASGLVFLGTQLKWFADLITVSLNRFSALAGVGFGVSLLNIGTGIIIGLRIVASMLLGGAIAWIFAPVWLADHGYLAERARRVDNLLLVMWPAVGLLVAGGISALALRWRVLLKTFRGLTGDAVSGEPAAPDRRDRERGVHHPAHHGAVVLLRHARVALGPGHRPLGTAQPRRAARAGRDQLGADLDDDQSDAGAVRRHRAWGSAREHDVERHHGRRGGRIRRSDAGLQGRLHDRITPRILTYMQLLAVPVGALALAWMYPLLRDTYGIIGEHAQLTSPTSQRWVGFARVMTNQMAGTGTAGAPGLTVAWMQGSFAVGAVIGVVLTLLEQIKRLKPFVPSPTGVGIAMLIPFSAVTTMFAGAMGDWIWARAHPESHRRYSVPLASGLIAGEALVAVIIPLLVTAGLMAAP